METRFQKLVKHAKGYRIKHGLWGVFALVFFPIVLTYTNALRLIATLWNSRVLANGRWSDYNRFRPQNGINSLFYWTQALNVDRFGRAGKSPYIGTGDYNLGQWWHLSLTSSYCYWRLGAILPLLSMFGWLGIHFFWFDHAGVRADWLLLVITLALISSYFYAGTFIFLNYNALGWLFMPLGLYGLLIENYWIASFAWIAASLGSFTVVFIAGCFTCSNTDWGWFCYWIYAASEKLSTFSYQ